MDQHPSLVNFGAGPAALPQEVLDHASAAIKEYKNSGLSILEIPHRGTPIFDDILAESKELVFQLTALDPKEYEVLWLQGGGRMQFAMIPMNFLAQNATAAYLDSGHWAYDAQETARVYGQIETIASSRNINYTALPLFDASKINPETSYLHITTNNTIYGTQMHQDINSPIPLIADMSSDIFAVERDYSKYDLFYAVAQKNLGMAGVTLVVVRKTLLGRIVRILPPILDYRQHAIHHSVLNTPPVFAIYVSLLYLRWMKEKGLSSIIAENQRKAKILYQEIERNSLLSAITNPEDRSLMNVVFRAKNETIEERIIAYCAKHRITGIKGHRSVGGFRVSLYNAISLNQTERLVYTLQEFEKNIPF